MKNVYHDSTYPRYSSKKLNQILHDFNVPNESYSIGAPAEQRVCIEKMNEKYCVYVMERGIRYEETFYTKEPQAHLAFLNQLASSDSEYEAMRLEYRHLDRMNQKRHMVASHFVSVNGQPMPARNQKLTLKRLSKKAKK